ncbi:sensor histidine kinase [Paracidovorax valerianellae]|uniref:Histidine kinase n=1 Tax=Paracidovorax valerianellae TaxID=187868 RepID=A0A1G6LUJ4_9BURK|nr:histidine kinase [Paracidovorax valerianellae]MDA8446158.1 histidine kinase [Paracidovorax valerianellae]SDC46744.1 Histidine kinase [Paracidovorax valerianellae]
MQHFSLRQFLRHGLALAAFCVAIAAVQLAYGRGPWDVQLVYSLAIGMPSWLLIDLGRLWLSRRSPIPWPLGWQGWALVAVGGTIGFHIGSAIGDAYRQKVLGAAAVAAAGGPSSAMVTTVLACLALAFFFYAQGKSRYLEGKIAEVERDAAEARLKLLETQLEPHLMFNTLANLRVLIATDPPRAQAMLDHLIDYLRATLGASRATLHPLADEFARLRDYLELMSVRMGPRLAYTLDLPESLAGVPVPPLLLQPLAENAIRHGLEPKVEGGTLHIAARQLADGRLELVVKDSGVGLADPAGAPTPPAGPAHQQSFGLRQVRERLHTLYGSDGTIELIAILPSGTCARAVFPSNPLLP